MASTLAPGVKIKLWPCPRCGPLETGAKKRSWGHGLAGAKSQLGAMTSSRPAPEDTVKMIPSNIFVWKRLFFCLSLVEREVWCLRGPWMMPKQQQTKKCCLVSTSPWGHLPDRKQTYWKWTFFTQIFFIRNIWSWYISIFWVQKGSHEPFIYTVRSPNIWLKTLGLKRVCPKSWNTTCQLDWRI